MRALAPDAKVVVGMSLGGLTALALTDRAPDLVRSARARRRDARREPREVVGDRAVHRRAGVLRDLRRDPRAHGRVQPDAQRVVAAARHPAQRDRRRPTAVGVGATTSRGAGAAKATTGRIMPGLDDLWDAVGAGAACRSRSCAAASSPVVDDDDVAEVRRRNPNAVVEVVEDAGHSVQGDKPLELARDPRGSALSVLPELPADVRRDPRRAARARRARAVGRVLPRRRRTSGCGRRRADSARRCSATASGCASTAPRSCTSAPATSTPRTSSRRSRAAAAFVGVPLGAPPVYTPRPRRSRPTRRSRRPRRRARARRLVRARRRAARRPARRARRTSRRPTPRSGPSTSTSRASSATPTPGPAPTTAPRPATARSRAVPLRRPVGRRPADGRARRVPVRRGAHLRRAARGRRGRRARAADFFESARGPAPRLSPDRARPVAGVRCAAWRRPSPAWTSRPPSSGRSSARRRASTRTGSPSACSACCGRSPTITDGFAVDQLTHSLQTATLAERAGADEEIVFASLLHDIGKAVSVPNHPEIAAAIIKPYVRPDVYNMIRVHQDFQGRHYYHHFGGDPDAREQVRGRAVVRPRRAVRRRLGPDRVRPRLRHAAARALRAAGARARNRVRGVASSQLRPRRRAAVRRRRRGSAPAPRARAQSTPGAGRSASRRAGTRPAAGRRRLRRCRVAISPIGVALAGRPVAGRVR